MADINEKDILLHQGEPAEAEPAIDADQGKPELNAAEAMEHEGSLNTAAQSIPDTLPVLPVRDVVIFNYMILPLFIGRDKSVQAVDAALKSGRHLLVCAQKEESTEDPKPEDIYEVGTVVQVAAAPTGGVDALVSLQIAATSGALQVGAADGVALTLLPLPYALLEDI